MSKNGGLTANAGDILTSSRPRSYFYCNSLWLRPVLREITSPLRGLGAAPPSSPGRELQEAYKESGCTQLVAAAYSAESWGEAGLPPSLGRLWVLGQPWPAELKLEPNCLVAFWDNGEDRLGPLVTAFLVQALARTKEQQRALRAIVCANIAPNLAARLESELGLVRTRNRFQATAWTHTLLFREKKSATPCRSSFLLLSKKHFLPTLDEAESSTPQITDDARQEREQSEFYQQICRRGPGRADALRVVSYNFFFYVLYWPSYGFTLASRRDIPPLDQPRFVAEFRTKLYRGSGGNSSDRAEAPSRDPTLWEREQATFMQAGSALVYVDRKHQPNLPAAPHGGQQKRIPTVLLGHCALTSPLPEQCNALIARLNHRSFHLYLKPGKSLRPHELLLAEYGWEDSFMQARGIKDIDTDALIRYLQVHHISPAELEKQMPGKQDPPPPLTACEPLSVISGGSLR